VEFVDTLMNTRQTQPRLPVPGELYQPTSVSPRFSSVVSERQHVLPSSHPSDRTGLTLHTRARARTHTHTHTQTFLFSCHTAAAVYHRATLCEWLPTFRTNVCSSTLIRSPLGMERRNVEGCLRSDAVLQ